MFSIRSFQWVFFMVRKRLSCWPMDESTEDPSLQRVTTKMLPACLKERQNMRRSCRSGFFCLSTHKQNLPDETSSHNPPGQICTDLQERRRFWLLTFFICCENITTKPTETWSWNDSQKKFWWFLFCFCVENIVSFLKERSVITLLKYLFLRYLICTNVYIFTHTCLFHCLLLCLFCLSSFLFLILCFIFCHSWNSKNCKTLRSV